MEQSTVSDYSEQLNAQQFDAGQFDLRVKPLLTSVYEPLGVDVDALCDRLQTHIHKHLQKHPPQQHSPSQHSPEQPAPNGHRWSQDDAMVLSLIHI